jgi:pyrimidine operon attenuation protein/uracil phosphoribosyltransferase
VLVDRGGRELPIAPDYLGIFLEVEAEQEVIVVDDGNSRLSIQVKRSVG